MRTRPCPSLPPVGVLLAAVGLRWMLGQCWGHSGPALEQQCCRTKALLVDVVDGVAEEAFALIKNGTTTY